MFEIRRIKPDEGPGAKQVVYRVAHVIFNDPRPLEESIAYYESNRYGVNDIRLYFENDLRFLRQFG